MSEGLHVAVVGATGLVGEEMIRILSERSFAVRRLSPLASERSIGQSVEFRGDQLPVHALTEASFAGVDLALFSAGGAVSREYAPKAVEAGAVVVDNSSAFRMDDDVPLVVPEVNPEALEGGPKLIANPNCSTIQMVVALKPLHDAATLKRVVVSTYQSASGAGRRGMEELGTQTAALLSGQDVQVEVHPARLAFNCIPHIDTPLEDGSTREEWKMVMESRKILALPELGVQATCVRVPVFCGHSEAVTVEFEQPLSPGDARRILDDAPGVVLLDDLESLTYPTVLDAIATDSCYVGRLRADPSVPHGLAFWVVADNLRKGAALNAVQIAEQIFS